MLALEGLRCFDRAARFPLSKPYFPGQGNTTCNDVNVILARILVAHGNPRRIGLVETHALHEVSRHGFPLLGAQALAGGQ
jgi:hypothetical protein